MSDKPGYLKTLEYSARWGIEPMFADFKSRGFGIEDTQLRYADRLDRLILVMALALYIAGARGSIPAARGERHGMERGRGRDGSIPAARGDLVAVEPQDDGFGSIPAARGDRRLLPLIGGGQGSIPAARGDPPRFGICTR